MIRFTLSILAIGLFIAAVLSVMGYTLKPGPGASGHGARPLISGSCVVRRIYDGDTIGCDMNGDGWINGPEEHIRLIGIDAPEMYYSPKNKSGVNQPYAEDATNLVKSETLTRRVYLEYDQDRIDKYHRILAYVYLDPQGQTMLNAQLLQRGLAKLMFIGANRRYEAEFETIKREAQAQHLGIWHNAF